MSSHADHQLLQGPGIGCSHCAEANISNNLILNADGHAGGTGALSVDMISQACMLASRSA